MTARRPRLAPGAKVDGFSLGERLHGGAMGELFRVTAVPDPGYPAVMKVPHFLPGDEGEGLVNFETEAMVLPALTGLHVPRVVAVGDFAAQPYLVQEWIEGESLSARTGGGPLAPAEVARIGAAIADALHSVHLQDAVHHDLKPANVILRPDGSAVLVDFGLAHHARFPDLLAEERRIAAGSPPYIAPEPVLGERGDPRSDLFSLGAVLYELATGQLPFGTPATAAGLRDRLWKDPVPPRALAPIPPWLQEVILKCLEPRVEDRYPSAALVAFDLRHPDSVELTSRALRQSTVGAGARLRRWWRAREAPTRPNRRPGALVGAARVVLVAVDTMHPGDERHPAVFAAVQRILSIPAEYRLIALSVIAGGPDTDAAADHPHLEHLARLRHWCEELRLPSHRLSFHVMEAADPAAKIVEFARRNHVDLVVLGAPAPGRTRMAWWRSVASGVAAHAPCTVHLVRVKGSASARDAGKETAAPEDAAVLDPP